VNQLPKSVVREIRTPRSVGTGGGRPSPVTRWALSNERPYREHSYFLKALSVSDGLAVPWPDGFVAMSTMP